MLTKIHRSTFVLGETLKMLFDKGSIAFDKYIVESLSDEVLFQFNSDEYKAHSVLTIDNVKYGVLSKIDIFNRILVFKIDENIIEPYNFDMIDNNIVFDIIINQANRLKLLHNGNPKNLSNDVLNYINYVIDYNEKYSSSDEYNLELKKYQAYFKLSNQPYVHTTEEEYWKTKFSDFFISYDIDTVSKVLFAIGFDNIFIKEISLLIKKEITKNMKIVNDYIYAIFDKSSLLKNNVLYKLDSIHCIKKNKDDLKSIIIHNLENNYIILIEKNKHNIIIKSDYIGNINGFHENIEFDFLDDENNQLLTNSMTLMLGNGLEYIEANEIVNFSLDLNDFVRNMPTSI